MMIRLALLWLLASACGGKSSERDAGPPIDARFLEDASVQTCAQDGDCAELAFETRCDLARSRCVECLSDTDCAQRPSFGPACHSTSKTCECESDVDCAGNAYGSYCHPYVKACGCITKDECDEEIECKLEPYLGTGIRRCYANFL